MECWELVSSYSAEAPALWFQPGGGHVLLPQAPLAVLHYSITPIFRFSITPFLVVTESERRKKCQLDRRLQFGHRRLRPCL
jgi:hypothetical protein